MNVTYLNDLQPIKDIRIVYNSWLKVRTLTKQRPCSELDTYQFYIRFDLPCSAKTMLSGNEWITRWNTENQRTENDIKCDMGIL